MANNWTPDAWLKPTLDDLFDNSKDVTSPAALTLIKASGILQTTQPDLKVLDNGAGMGQIAEALISSEGPKSMKIVCGDINDGLLSKLKATKEREGWANVEVQHLDATNMPEVPDQTFDYNFGNFLYFLTPDPTAALKESLRTLRIGGTLGFTTWALSGPFQLCQLAQAHLSDYPLAPPPWRLNGSWNHPRYVESQLKEIGYTEVKVTPFSFTQEASSAEEMVKKMWHALMLLTEGWGDERREKGWELGRSMEKALRAQQGDGKVAIISVALLVIAKRAS